MNKIIITLVVLLIIPFVYSLDQESSLICSGDSETQIMCLGDDELSILGKLTVPSVVEVSTPVASQASQRTDCHTLADQYKTCYFVNSEIQCEAGCSEGYYCDDSYRCQEGKLVTEEKTTTLLEKTNENKKVIFTGILVALVVSTAIVAEEEIRRKKKTKKELKENQEELPQVEKSKEE